MKYVIIVLLTLNAAAASAIEISEFPHYEMDIHLTPSDQTIRTEGIHHTAKK